ncbi:unnamed protein product [Sympodiomycopsis kandeliae]
MKVTHRLGSLQNRKDLPTTSDDHATLSANLSSADVKVAGRSNQEPIRATDAFQSHQSSAHCLDSHRPQYASSGSKRSSSGMSDQKATLEREWAQLMMNTSRPLINIHLTQLQQIQSPCPVSSISPLPKWALDE